MNNALNLMLCGICMIACSAVILAQTGRNTPTPDFKDIEFAKVPSTNIPSLTLDVYLPKGIAAPFPVVVYVHPGGWSSGKKEDVAEHVGYLTNAGFAVVSINYRLSGDTVFPAPLHDCKAAVRWLRANASRYNLDPNNIGTFGHSAGAHLASMLGVTSGVKTASSGAVAVDMEGSVGGNMQYSSGVKAVADFFGPSNLVEFYKITPQGSGSNLVGCQIVQCPDKAKLASSTTYAARTSPSFLIMHGTADDVVPFSQSQLLDSALRIAGATVTFTPVQSANHGFDMAWQQASIQAAVVSFFTKHLKSSTSVAEEATNDAVFTIFPNPASNLAMVSFLLQTSQHVSLKIFNILGQEIATILDETLPVGEHRKSLLIRDWALVSQTLFVQLKTQHSTFNTIPLRVMR